MFIKLITLFKILKSKKNFFVEINLCLIFEKKKLFELFGSVIWYLSTNIIKTDCKSEKNNCCVNELWIKFCASICQTGA